jgi:hypothetical protein
LSLVAGACAQTAEPDAIVAASAIATLEAIRMSSPSQGTR